MSALFLDVGHKNIVAVSKILVVVSIDSAPMKRLRDEAKKEKKIIDATQGRKTLSLIIMVTGHVILSSLKPETIRKRGYID